VKKVLVGVEEEKSEGIFIYAERNKGKKVYNS